MRLVQEGVGMYKIKCDICGKELGETSVDSSNGHICGKHTSAEIKAYFNPETWESIRSKRDDLLTSTDWTQLSDSPLSDSVKNQYKTYRQLLRDLPKTAENPNEIIFPNIP